MSEQQVDHSKRTWLIASSCAGAVGGIATAVPFVSTFQPSERARAAGAAVEADISALKPGEKMTVEWRGKPVWILRRTKEMVDSLPKLDGDLRDPQSEEGQQPAYARNAARSIRPEVLVLLGVCTHLGCSPQYKKEPTVELQYGGFYCPCHGSKFDFAGRVYKGVPAPLNLEVPPHFYESDSVIVVGEDQGAA